MTDKAAIRDKVFSGQRLDFKDAKFLFSCDDIFFLAELADFVKKKFSGNYVYYTRNIHLNYSNICINLCPICAFGKPKEDKNTWQWSVEEAIEYVHRNAPVGLREIHIVGGVNPDYPYSFYKDLLIGLKKSFPQASLKAFTAVEIDYIASSNGKSIEDVLQDFKACGLGMLPGGGGDIFSQKVRQEICPKKISAQRYLEIHRVAHKLGIKSNCTILYAHIETIEDRIEHLLKIRDLQDETGNFLCMVPLAFQPHNTKFSYIYGSDAITDIKVHAISRIMLDNIAHVKAYWVMTGVKMAQVLLSFGVDDLDGTIVREKVAHMAGAATPEGLTEGELRNIILRAGKMPVCRDAFYQKIDD